MRWRLFFFFVFVFLLFTSREPPWADAHVTYDTTQSLVDHWQLDVHTIGGPPWFYAHHDHKKFGVFPLGNVVAMVPSYLAYKLAHHTLHELPDKDVFAFCSHLSPALLMAGACVLFFLLLLRRGASERWALFGTLTLGLATFCFIYSRVAYSEALQTLAMLWMVERTLAQGDEITVAGLGWLAVACGLLVNTKLVYVLLLPFVACYLIDRHARRGTLRHLLRAAPLALLVFGEFSAVLLWHNHLKTGSMWLSGYQIPHGVFSGDLLPAIYGFTLSSGKSAFLYSPPILLGVLGIRTAWRRRRAETAFLLSLIVTTVLFNSKFRHWHADYCWGPRHLVAITPLLLMLAFPWLPEALHRGRRRYRQAALGALVGLGLCVQLLGSSFYWDHYIRMLIAVKNETGAAGWFQESLSHGHYIPAFSPLRGNVWMLRHFLHKDPDLDRDAPWKKIMPMPADLSNGWERMRLDWWALDWRPLDGKSPWPGVILFSLLAGGTLFCAVSLSSKSGTRRREQER